MAKKEQPLISFCMPVYGDADTVEWAVDSIVDQDYPNIEVILSVDGCKESEKAVKKLVKKYKGNKKKVTAIYAEKNRGACIARNEAAKIAEGKYLSFLPADAALWPGVARIWVEHLEMHPDYDFLYGGYRFLDQLVPKEDVAKLAKEAKMEVDDYLKVAGYKLRDDGDYDGTKGFDYMSEPFDPYFLDQHNYIDGSFPLTKESFERSGGWDPEIKSLQDWDLWLSVVKSGGKGIFIRDVFFETTFPHHGGLSHDSSVNWVERCRQIKKKQGINDNKICVTSLGAPFHGKRTARVLDADYKDMPSFKPHRYEAVYMLGFFATLADQSDQAFRNCAGKRIIHWIGSDIWQLQQMSKLDRDLLLSYFEGNIDAHLCEADFTKKELKELGIEAKIVPLPPRWLYKPLPMPDEYTVAVYQPQTNQGFYRPDLMKEVADLCPEIKFKFFGDNSRIGKLNNIDFVGYVNDMDKFIEECSAIMRFPLHDGLPLSVLEFITAGRQAVTSVPIKYASHVDGQAQKIAAELKKLAKANEVNEAGSKYWNKKLNHKKYKKTIESIVKYDPKEYWEQRSKAWIRQSDGNYSLPPADIESIRNWLADIDFDSVLDIGCGSGRMVDWFKDKQYIGIDISEELINECRDRYPDLRFSDIRLEDLTLEEPADLIFSYTTLEHITDETWPQAIEALKRNGKKALIIEPIDFENLGHCHSHDYEKDLNVIKKLKLSDKTMFLVDLT